MKGYGIIAFFKNLLIIVTGEAEFEKELSVIVQG